MAQTTVTSVRGVTNVHVLDDASVLESRRVVAVTGPRTGSTYGEALAREAGCAIAEAGAVLLTSAALGASVAAARACLDAGGRVAVAAFSGADFVYPKASADVFAAASCVVSMEEDGAYPKPAATKRRDQLVAALSDALIVCDAGKPAAAVTLAETFAFAHKPVFAFPGSVLSPSSAGSNELLSRGVATPLWSTSDLEPALASVRGPRQAAPSAKPAEGAVRDALRGRPKMPGAIAEETGLGFHEVLSTLSVMESRGEAVRLLDGRYATYVRRVIFRP